VQTVPPLATTICFLVTFSSGHSTANEHVNS
jgi:hypothetical protein